jgi:hypothetical protein
LTPSFLFGQVATDTTSYISYFYLIKNPMWE